MTWLVEKPIAHRGLHSGTDTPENSLLAFQMAVQEGCPMELDVQFLADESLVVFHDDTLARLTGQDGITRSQTYSALKALRLYATDQQIPLFTEVLELVGGKVPLLVELKSDGTIGPFEARLRDVLRDYNGEFAVESFSSLSVEWFRINAPEVCRGQLSGDFRDWDGRGSPNFLACDHRSLPNQRVAEERRKRGIPLLAWTVTSPEEYARVKPHVDNVIFEGFRIPQ